MQKTPPRYVPTLTQVIAPQGEVQLLSSQASKPKSGLPPNIDLLANELRDQLLEATHQYLNRELERRIREIASQIALEHAHKIFEELQSQLESTINRVVDEAVIHAILQVAKEPVTHPP